jgi:alcohol dehydrogenase
MKAITFQGIESLAFGDVPDPVLRQGGDALVRVSVAGVCGSDLHPYFGREVGIEPGTVMGHEFVGTVAEVGPGVDGLHTGDVVVSPFTTSCGACFYCTRGLTARCERGQLFGWIQDGEGLHGAQAELVRVPLASSTLVKVPPGLDLEVALLAGDILSTALFGAHLASVEKGDSVVVVGCGPVGALAVLASLHRGAERVFALDRVPERLELAERWGAIPVDVSADDVVEAVRNGTGGRGADAAIEAVGSSDATRLAADVLRLGGRLSAVGVHTEPHLALSPGEIYDRNLTYSAGRCPARAFMPQALELAQRHQDRLKSLISHRFPLARGVEAYRVFAERRDGCTKAVLIP